MYMNSSRKSILTGLLLLVAVVFTQAQVGVGTSSPHTSAKLEVSSTNQGFLPPRMTTVQRNAISNPASGLVIFNTTSNALNIYFSGAWYQLSTSLPSGSIATLITASPTDNGTLTAGTPANGVSTVVSYTGGNGEAYSGETVSSTNVTGLTATLSAGTFAVGNGNLTYNISGTASGAGTASFALNIGGQSGTISRTVTTAFTCGTSTVTFTYRSQSVTYGTAVGANGTCWLDRNLGATQVATSSTDANSYGDLFQWGRNDDGHQLRNSNTTNTTSSIDVPNNGGAFIVTGGGRDWRDQSNNSLWQGVNGTNNPCPTGWRVPTEAEFTAESNSWTSANSTGAFGSLLKFPVSGRRSDFNGNLANEGAAGFYWTSTTSNSEARHLVLNNSVAYANAQRAGGFSVRCIKDY
jgi:uncharacterized protein (TIGR02145 family)